MRKIFSFISFILCTYIPPIFATESPKEFEIVGEIRVRGEFLNNHTDFNSNLYDGDIFVPTRSRLGVKIDLPKKIKTVFSLQNISRYGQFTDKTDQPRFFQTRYGQFAKYPEEVWLYEAYFQIENFMGSPWQVKIGRQEMGSYGREMLIGDADFESGNKYDAVKFNYQREKFHADFWWGEVQRNERATHFFGVYTTSYPYPKLVFDGYLLYNLERQSRPREERFTLGIRIERKPTNNLTFNAETAFQFGNNYEKKIRSYALETEAKYIFPKRWNPILSLGYALASGDNDPEDNIDRTFDPLFQDNHPRFGSADFFFLENLSIFTSSLTLQMTKNIKYGVNLLWAWVREIADQKAPRYFQPGTYASHKDLARETDFYLHYIYSPNLSFTLNWSRLFPSRYIKDKFTSNDPHDRYYLNTQLNF